MKLNKSLEVSYYNCYQRAGFETYNGSNCENRLK